MLVLANRTLPSDALDFEGVSRLWRSLAQAQDEQMIDRAFLRERLRQTLAIEIPGDVIADINGRSVVLSRASKRDRVVGIWIAGKGETAVVVDAKGSTAALESDVVKRLEEEGRPILLLVGFQTGAGQAPRSGEILGRPLVLVRGNAEDEGCSHA